MKIIAIKSMRVMAPGDRLFRLPTTEASIFNLSRCHDESFLSTSCPQNPLLPFQHFIPIFLVNDWVQYTNNGVSSLIHSGVINSQEHKITEQSRLYAWKPTTAAEVYIWHGILIYMGIHSETTVEDHWKTSQLEDQRPKHSIIEFISYNAFPLFYRHICLFDHTKFTDSYDDFPIAFNALVHGLGTFNLQQQSSVSRARILPSTKL